MEISAEKTLDGKRDYLQVAAVVRTLRDKLDGLITSGAMDLGTQRKILLDISQELNLVVANNATHRYDEVSTCTHSCCEHEQVMNPGLWSTLPMELLQRVFAKLPFLNICRLKSLSKEWQLSLQSSSSEFTLALKESSPRILARVTPGAHSSFCLYVLDGRNNRWHELRVAPGVAIARDGRLMDFSSAQRWVHMNGASDAGLVCYITKNLLTGLNSIFVTNPMTGVVRELPISNVLAYSYLAMMRIIVDRDTYHYKVIIVKRDPSVEAEVYDSEVQLWTKPKPSLGRIFGIAYYWYQDEYAIWSADKSGPCAYDCRDGKYYDFGQDMEKWLGKKVMSYTLMKDRLFVVYWDQEEYTTFISEYCVPENTTSWVRQETHSCFSQFRSLGSGVPKITHRIHGCSGFLFVFILKGGGFVTRNKKHEYGWVYDLSTFEWRALPPVPWWATIQSIPLVANVMCEVHWNIRP